VQVFSRIFESFLGERGSTWANIFSGGEQRAGKEHGWFLCRGLNLEGGWIVHNSKHFGGITGRWVELVHDCLIYLAFLFWLYVRLHGQQFWFRFSCTMVVITENA